MAERDRAARTRLPLPTQYGALSFQNALRLARELTRGGYTDWRVPNIRELYSLAVRDERARDRPDLYPFEFAAPPGYRRYWSSRVAWNWPFVVIFYTGWGAQIFDLTYSVDNGGYLRCVRGPVDLMGER